MQKKEDPLFVQKEMKRDQPWQIHSNSSSYILIPHKINWITCQANPNSFEFFYIEEKRCYFLKKNKTFIFNTMQNQNCFLIEIKQNINELPSTPLD